MKDRDPGLRKSRISTAVRVGVAGMALTACAAAPNSSAGKSKRNQSTNITGIVQNCTFEKQSPEPFKLQKLSHEELDYLSRELDVDNSAIFMYGYLRSVECNPGIKFGQSFPLVNVEGSSGGVCANVAVLTGGDPVPGVIYHELIALCLTGV